MHRILTVDEIAALSAFHAEHGRNWKDALRGHWERATAPQLLHALRNEAGFGPAGLSEFRFLAAVRAALKPHGVSIRWESFGEEYHTNFIGGTEATASYSDDIADSYGTGLAMARFRDARKA